MTTARQAYAVYSMGLPASQAEITQLIKEGKVGKVFRGDVEALKGKFKDFVVGNNLITDDKTVKKVGGVGRVVYRGEVDKLTGGAASKVHEAVKAINKMLADQKAPYHAFCYFKDDRAHRTPAPAPAPAVAGQPAKK
jgi:hypothetical protein